MMQPIAQGPVRIVLSVVLSVLVPGLGSAVNGRTVMGVGILVATLTCWAAAFFFIGIPFLIMVYVWAMYDAYRSAYDLGAYRIA